MGQCLALLNTTAFGIDRGEYLKINPNGRIPASSLAIFDSRLWPISEMATPPIVGRLMGHSGPDLLALSFSHFVK
jgi:hypothetical protein